MADLKTAPLWLIRFNTVLLWLNPGLSLAAVVLALLVIAAAGERWPGNRTQCRATGRSPRGSAIARAVPSIDVSPELRDLYLYD